MILLIVSETSKPIIMKKIVYIAALILWISTPSMAQKQGIAINDKVIIGHGWTVGNRNSDDLKRAFHPTVQVGRSALFNVSDNVGIGLGTFFSTEGGSFKFDNNTEARKAVQRMNYIRIPLGATFTFGNIENKVRPYLGIGGSIGFLVGGKTYILGDNDAFVGAKTTKVMSTKIDAGGTATLGYGVRVSNGLFINHEINYYHGLVENKYDDTNLPSFTHRNLGLSLGVTFTGEAMKSWKGKMKSNHHK